MKKSQSILVGLTILVFFMAGFAKVTTADQGDGNWRLTQSASLVQLDRSEKQVVTPRGAEPTSSTPSVATDIPGIRVMLSAERSTTSWDERDPNCNKFNLPLLALHEGREAAPQTQRTLDIHIAGPVGGSDIQIEVVSHHEDVTTDQRHAQTKLFHLPDRLCTDVDPCIVEWTFDPGTMLSDFYSLRIKDAAEKTLWENPQPNHPDFVALDTWDEAFGDYTVRVYYATLFTFARGEKNRDDRLSPAGVREFVGRTFAPIIRETWHTQVEGWGFGQPLHPGWDADRVVDVIITDSTFALFGGTGTYTVSILGDGNFYPERRIWWRANSANFLFYDTLEDGYKVVFAHEFFHLMQTNVLLAVGQPANRWHSTFIEAQATFASSLQYPELELAPKSAYMRAANRFLASRLNTSYNELLKDSDHPYDATLYWRFLYDQYQDMEILRFALEEMAQGYEPDLVSAISGVMDRVFVRFDGPYHDFDESLIAFARANYALRLENGRCADRGLAQCDGLYFDPGNRYVRPRLEAKRHYDGGPLTINGAIPASYGMDFVEIGLNTVTPEQPSVIRFQAEEPTSQFSIQVWRLAPGGKAPRAITLEPEIIQETLDGAQVYLVPRVDTTAHDQLALIITRLDPNEVKGPDGNYIITVTPSH